ncbi:acetylornithine deacetylase [uncultured Roseovarius sp.]|uniref:acetylornithine deacetylase n=1 Tax=uncultured Roseovarius sp. TaxID=293344 RepID=UPI0026152C59|nr:acetylornithine deacetylase [uncultured Roseovarius sp.]
MADTLNSAIEILENLVGFDSVSGRPNQAIVGYIKDTLEAQGVDVILSYDVDGERANVFATIGPRIDGGIVLNGHTDVVPVEGQDWASDPFKLTRIDDRLYGRGSVDMKGFLACVMASVPVFQAAQLTRPIHIAFTYDEEIGGLGMPVLLDSMEALGCKPSVVIVGEPTEMNIVTGHKAGDEMRTEITGHEVHSSDPRGGVSAISTATRLIAKIEEIGARLAADPVPGSPYDPPYATFNIGTIEGGAARNATAGWCNFDWEFRGMPGQDSRAIIGEIEDFAAQELLPVMKAVSPKADIKIITEVAVPPLDDRNAARAAAFVSEITGQNSQSVVSFGTDAGYFSDKGLSTVVFGPGTIRRAHGADEYIEVTELQQGLNFLRAVAEKLAC